MEKLKKYSCSSAVFLINVLLLFLGYHAIKNNDKNIVEIKEDNQIEVNPLSQKTLDMQSEIVVDRENKLRDLNSAPKQLQQNQVTTQTTTTTPAATKKSSTATKTS